MTPMEEFKKKFAEEKGYMSFQSLWLNTLEYRESELINELCERFARECCKASLKQAEVKFVEDYNTLGAPIRSISDDSNIVILK